MSVPVISSRWVAALKPVIDRSRTWTVTAWAPRCRSPAPSTTSARAARRPSSSGEVESSAVKLIGAASLPRNGDAHRGTPEAGELLLLVAHRLAEQARPAEAGLVLVGGGALQLHQHLMLVDHVGEFESDPVGARPGDAGRDAGGAAIEDELGADGRHVPALDQRALAGEIAQPG